MKASISSICALLLVATALAIPTPKAPKPVSYDGVKVVRIQLDDTKEQARRLDDLIKRLDLETWTHEVKPNHRVDVVVEPEKLADFNEGLKGIPYTAMHEDLGKSIREESAPSGTLDVKAQADMSWFNSYHSYADHLSWLSQLATQFPARAKIVTVGKSYQNRDITGIHIYGSSGGGTKPAIIFHSTVHAREWITTMVNEFLAYQLLNNYANSTEIKEYVNKYDFYIFPVVNPDGFIFSQTNTRLWRKNRAPVSGNSCLGTDINRNWNIAWGHTGGASTNPCDQDYKGPSAGSTPEYKALSAFQDAKAKTQGVKMYMDIHSYSQLWMSPYGYSCSGLPSSNTRQVSISRGAAAALKAVYGTTFKTGPICNTIYKVTGGSTDYSYDVTKAKYSFAVELRDTGNYGFVLPANQIYPSGNEMWAAIKYTIANIV